MSEKTKKMLLTYSVMDELYNNGGINISGVSDYWNQVFNMGSLDAACDRLWFFCGSSPDSGCGFLDTGDTLPGSGGENLCSKLF
jgi:hypothetical protein